MKKRHAAIFAFLVTGLIISNIALLSILNEGQMESVLISEITDGDTIKLEDGRTIRLLNINSPEKNQPLSDLATNFLKQYENKTVEIEISGIGIYGRQLGRIYADSYINLELVSQGLSHKYLVEHDEIDEFIEQEAKAQEAELGIWKKSEDNGCLSAEINKKEEFVNIVNTCNKDFNNLALKDESTRTFTFTIEALSAVILYSGPGQDSYPEIYLESKRNIWNNDKDSIFIRDENGLLMYYDSYGY